MLTSRPGHLRGGRPGPGRVDHVHRGRPRSSTGWPSTPATAAASPSTGPRRPSAWPSGAGQVPQVETDHPGLKEVIARSAEDLGALRIFDPDYPERVVVAAGAPWFMTVFGRDSLLTAWMALLVDPDLARGVLQTLARFQGEGRRPPPRRGARPHPPRDALRGRRLPLAGRGQHLLRDGRRHPAVRHAAGGDAPLGRGPGDGRRAPPQRRPGHRVDRAVRRRRRRRLRRVPAGHRPGPGQPGLEGQLGRHPLRRRPGGRGPHRPVRGAGLHLRRLPGQRPLRLRGGGHGHLRPLPGQGHPAEGGLQPRLLAGGQGVVRRRPRRRQAAHRLADLQHRPLPVDRDRRRGQGPPGGGGAGVAGHVHRLGGAHPVARTAAATTRSATTAARSGPTTRPSWPPAWPATATTARPRS